MCRTHFAGTFDTSNLAAPNLKPAQCSQQLRQKVCCAHSADSKKNRENYLFNHGSPPPVLFGFAFDCWSSGVLHFEPIRGAARTVGRVLPLRDTRPILQASAEKKNEH